MRFRSKWGTLAAGALILIFLKLFWWHAQISSVHYDDYKESINQQPQDMFKPKIRKGLNYSNEQFTLNGKPITIISGAVHYFRFPRQYWEDRLIKMKACGLNTIDTYVPWNLHEPIPGKYDFDGDLDLVKFLLLAKRLDFNVILRPGPYICSEWEFGGLPSWLLRDPTMKVRTMHPLYIKAVESYFDKLLPLVKPLQYQYGGPIIAFQLDNEYGSYFKDSDYIPYLKALMEINKIDEFFLISDSIKGLEKQTIPGVLKTANFKHVESHLLDLQRMQPHAPLMVMEFWTGWFDWWGFDHHLMPLQEFSEALNQIFSMKASVNFYMFYGGTNFGFMNGGFKEDGIYKSDVTSYDYDALLAENGDVTPKYYKAKSIIQQYYPQYVEANKKHKFSDKGQRTAYNSVNVDKIVSLWEVLSFIPVLHMENPQPMEMLDINQGAGQSYGYALYRAKISAIDKLSVVLSGLENIFDRGILFVNNLAVAALTDSNKHLPLTVEVKGNSVSIDLLIENGGRINWEVLDDQRKGLLGPVLQDDIPIINWEVYPIEMKKDFIEKLFNTDLWLDTSTAESFTLKSPSFFKVTFNINAEPQDTYIDMREWEKGVVFVNGKNLGRYWSIGPQQALFVPSPWLYKGKNSIVIFEENRFAPEVTFSSEPILG